MSFPPDILEKAFFHILRNEEEIARSQSCCCYFCQTVFAAHAITEWCDEPADSHHFEPEGWEARGNRSAVCPNCDADNVIGSASGFPVTDVAFVAAMHNHHWGDAKRSVS
jgi:hypothetical protein